MWAARASGVATAQRYSDSCKRWRLGRDSGGGSLLRQQHLRRRHPPPLQLLAWPAPAHLHPSIHSAFERSSDRQHDALSSTPSTTPATQDDVAREEMNFPNIFWSPRSIAHFLLRSAHRNTGPGRDARSELFGTRSPTCAIKKTYRSTRFGGKSATAVTLVPFPSTAESDIRSNLANRGSRGRHTPLPLGWLGSEKITM